jgi:hypothetical protein
MRLRRGLRVSAIAAIERGASHRTGRDGSRLVRDEVESGHNPEIQKLGPDVSPLLPNMIQNGVLRRSTELYESMR